MTLPQQNTASARPTSFYYLMCQLDRVQYQPFFVSIVVISMVFVNSQVAREENWNPFPGQ